MVLSSVEIMRPFFLSEENVLQGYNDSCFLDFSFGCLLVYVCGVFFILRVGNHGKLKDSTCNTVQYCL